MPPFSGDITALAHFSVQETSLALACLAGSFQCTQQLKPGQLMFLDRQNELTL